jgi:hypothetical protein
MPARAFRLAAALGLMLPFALRAQAFEYAATSGQYRVTSKTTGTQDAMGQTQQFQTSNNQLLSVSLARATRDTMALTIVVDSVNAVGPMGMPMPGLDKLVGQKISAKLSPVGVVYSAQGPADDSVPNGSQITTELSRLLPRIKAKLAPGAAWTDTVTGTVKQNGMSIDRQVIATYAVAGDTTVQGQKAWKLTRETNTSMTGGGAPQGQMMSMEGTATGKGIVVMGQNGVYLGGTSEDHANIKITLTAQAMDVTVTTTSNTAVEKVK